MEANEAAFAEAPRRGVHFRGTSIPEPEMTAFDRITHDPRVMGGKPTIRGLRVTVGMVVGQIGAGRTLEQVLEEYPYLDREDVLQALRYAAWRADDRELALADG
jgi:uncharacterized protein (DUF433 family)